MSEQESQPRQDAREAGETGDAAESAPQQPLPSARIERARPWRSWYWLVPAAALVVVAVLVLQSISHRGERIRISFRDGNGVRVGDPIVFRGVQVGEVTAVTLDGALNGVRVVATLNPDAAGLAVQGAKFWIVHPQVSLTRIEGLETLLGPRYIEVAPSDGGTPAHEFVGLERSPQEEEIATGGLKVILQSQRVGSLSVGSPVTYREVHVGSITAIGLSADGRLVEITAVISPAYRSLVRDNTRFWNSSGIGLDMGFSGLKFKAESLSTIVSGGVAFATPNNAGGRVDDGHRFTLEAEVDSDWLKWSPDLSPPAQSAAAGD